MRKYIILVFLFAAGVWPQASAQTAIDTSAREAILVDAGTGTVLFEKNADTLMHPASMSKLMTIAMVFDRLADGSIKMEDTFPVSESAWRIQGSKMFVELGARIPVGDLLRGIIVQSGNDACVVVAEGISGDEQNFARKMTERAREIGMTHSEFRNASGWPDPEHMMTARDLATLAGYLVNKHKQYYGIFSEIDFTWHGIKQGNRNPLLYSYPGADGLKTGHTEEAGYGLTGSAERNGRRLIVVVTGLDSDKHRGIEAERLLTLGFNEFETYTLLSANQKLDEADVWLGDADKIPLVAGRDIRVTLPRAARKSLQAKLVYQAPLAAPVAQGMQVGTVTFTADGMQPVTVPVIAGATVEKLGYFGKIPAAFNYLLWGASSG
ncbi:MAG: D-alanyl-D-alanine carboxypeptidase family protein [Alphaproteobacteria bacterium]